MVMGLLDVAPSAVAAKYKGINLVAISFLLFLVLNFNAAVRNNNPHDFIKTKLFSYKLNELPNQQYHDPIWTEALLTLRRNHKSNRFRTKFILSLGSFRVWQR